MASGLTVRAAGGVVWRRDSAGALEVLVVHRPRYDDWTLPKGKLIPGEGDEEVRGRTRRRGAPSPRARPA